jgi:hypothetical protein
MTDPDSQSRRRGYEGPDTESINSHTVTTSTTYTSNSSSSFGFGIGSANSGAALLPSQDLLDFGSANFQASLLPSQSLSFRSELLNMSDEYETWSPKSFAVARARDAARRELVEKQRKRDEIRNAIIMAIWILAVFAIPYFLNTREEESSEKIAKNAWTIWIPLGPVKIGYGSEGFQWSIGVTW